MFEKNSGVTKVTFSTPAESEWKVGYLFGGGISLINRDTGDAEIIIDPSLSPGVQLAYWRHEQTQLHTIRDAGGHEGVMATAHFNGLEAGYDTAKSFGVESEYRTHRGEW